MPIHQGIICVRGEWKEVEGYVNLKVTFRMSSGYWEKINTIQQESTVILMSTSLLLGEDNGIPLQYSCLKNPLDGGAWWTAVHGVATSWTWLSSFTFTFHFHALEEEVATHSSVLAWRIPGMGAPGGLLSMGSYRVGHNWSDLAAAAAAAYYCHHSFVPMIYESCLFPGNKWIFSLWSEVTYKVWIFGGTGETVA